MGSYSFSEVNGRNIRNRLHEYGLILLLGQTSITATGSNHLTDTNFLQSSAIPSTAYSDCWVRMAGETSPNNVPGEKKKVDYLDQDNGKLYVSPSFGASPTDTIDYEIWRQGLDPDVVDRYIDLALMKICSQWALRPLTLVLNPSYNIEITDTAPLDAINWTRGNSTITQLAHDSVTPSLWRRYVRITNTGTNGELQSANINVMSGDDQFYLYVPVRAISGTALLVVRDETNSANITLSGTATTTLGGWTGIEVTGTIPTTCRNISVRLRGTESNAIIDWGPVFLHPQGTKIMPVGISPYAFSANNDPSYNIGEDDIGSIFRLTDYPIIGTGIVGQENMREVTTARRTTVFSNPVVRFENNMENKPYAAFIREFFQPLAPATALLYNTATTRTARDGQQSDCDPGYAAAGAAKLIAETMMHRYPAEADFYASVLAKAEKDLAVFGRRFGAKEIPILEREKSIYIPQVEV